MMIIESTFVTCLMQEKPVPLFASALKFIAILYLDAHFVLYGALLQNTKKPWDISKREIF